MKACCHTTGEFSILLVNWPNFPAVCFECNETASLAFTFRSKDEMEHTCRGTLMLLNAKLQTEVGNNFIVKVSGGFE